MKIISRIKKEFSDTTLKPVVSFELNEIQEDLQEIPDNELVQIEIKRIKSKRSLNANAYYWAVVYKIADKIGLSNIDVHLELLKKYSEMELISIHNSVKIENYIKYFEKIGENGSFNDYLIFKGSSEMDTKEFSRLLQGALDEAKDLGITVLSLEEIMKGKQ